jgi:hypothetical protein
VSVDDNERIRIVGTSNFELSEVGFELDIALREEELGVIFVEDTVRDAGAIDAPVDLDICTITVKKFCQSGLITTAVLRLL